MSHLISGVQVEGPLVFHMSPPCIIKPRFKRYLKSNTLENFFTKDSEAKILNQICHRYSQIQHQKIMAQRQLFIGNKCSELKRKIRHKLDPKVEGKSVESFFQEDKEFTVQQMILHPLNVKRLTEGMPPRIELQRKYQTKINIKMASVEEAKTIQFHKKCYKDQANRTCKYNKDNSPNFNKMAFVFQQLQNKSVHQNTKSLMISAKNKDLIEIVTQINEKKLSPSVKWKQNHENRQYQRHSRKQGWASGNKRYRHLTGEQSLFNLH